MEGEVWRLVAGGEMKGAIAACQQLNQRYPGYAAGWRSASQLAQRLNNQTMALSAIDRALELEPDEPEWILQRAHCLAQLGRIAEARPLALALTRRKLKNGYQFSTLGLLLSRLGLNEEALQQYQQAIRLEPADAAHYYNQATVYRFIGNFDAAEASLARAIEINPKEYEAYSLRSELRKVSPDKNNVRELEGLLQSGISDRRGEVRIRYALAKELEDMGQAENAFSQLRKGADLRRKMMRYDVSGDLDTMTSIQQHFSEDFFRHRQAGYENEEAIFILGMPRTGTTLVERIIGSHSEVFAAGELNNFAIELTRLAGRGKVSKQALVACATQVDFAALGRAYIESTRPATAAAPRFIDKMPLNFLYAGLIQRALPAARIINLQRHPLDTCYAIYKTLFKDAYPFSYTLPELGRYYLAYRQLMRHWESVLPGVIHVVNYEKLVHDMEGTSRALLRFCGLPWEDQCLRFYANRQSATTASASQVRRAIYTSSVGRWRDYRQQLEPLIEVLLEGGMTASELEA